MPSRGDRPPQKTPGEPAGDPVADQAAGAPPFESEPTSAFDRRAAARAAAFKDRQARMRESFESRERRRRDIFDSCDVTRQTMVATGEFYRSMGAAVADAFEAFNAELDPDVVRATGATRSTFEALAEGNARFFDSLAESSRRVFDELRAKPDSAREADRRFGPVDHELLAQLVAEELRKTGPPA